MITNPGSKTRVDEVADGIYRISTPVDLVPGGFSFNQYLVVDEEPLLFHTGPRRMFPLVREAVAAVLPVERLRHVGFSHFEADECGSLNEFLAVDASRSPRPPRANILSGRGRLDPSARRLGPWNPAGQDLRSRDRGREERHPEKCTRQHMRIVPDLSWPLLPLIFVSQPRLPFLLGCDP